MKIIENRMNDLYVRLSWSHKIQEKQSDIYKSTDKIIKITRIVLASLISSGIISILINDNIWIKIVTALLSLGTLLINGIGKTFNYDEIIRRHKITANEFLLLKDEVGYFLDDIKMNIISEQEAIIKRNELHERFKIIVREAPITTEKAVLKAKISLNVDEESTISEKEKNKMIPRYKPKE